MKRPLFVWIALLGLLALGVTGCTSLSSSRTSTVNRPRSFALAVTVNNADQPTAEQWAVIQANFSRWLNARGWVLVNDVSLADHILRVNFTHDPSDPESKGVARIVRVMKNPLSTVARRGTSPYPSYGFGYADPFASNWPLFSSYYSGYSGYGSFYSDSYWGSSWTHTPVTKPTTPPRHHPGDRDHCPSPIAHPTGRFAGPDSIDSHPRPPPRDYGRFSGERAVSRADRADHFPRSDWSSRSDNFHSSSAHSSSYDYSPPASSYSASSSSSVASSSAAASMASSAPPVESVSSAH